MIPFCTLFDSNFLTRGIALYESLYKHCDSFHLYIFALDGRCSDVLKKLSLKNTTIISHEEFESPELLALKSTRTNREYFWTCASNSIRYAIDQFRLDSCTYLDADLYFWDSPRILFDEIGDNSILITKHHYSPKYDQSKLSGKYCVQFITFRNNEFGNKALNWWRDACNEWCYDRFEDGKYGDQKYLNILSEHFKGVHVLQHLGGGIAPWNVQKYNITQQDNKLICTSKQSGESFPVVFYHFHHVRFYEDSMVDIGGYAISKDVKRHFYKTYLEHLDDIANRLSTNIKTIRTHGESELQWSDPRAVLRHLKHLFLGTVFKKKSLINY